MRVQRVLMPNESESWTVLDGGGEPVGEVEAFLAHLQALDRSPTTLRTYATSLKLWLQFLEPLGVAVDEATVENVSRFVGWLRAPAENVAVLDGGTGRCWARSCAGVPGHVCPVVPGRDFPICLLYTSPSPRD